MNDSIKDMINKVNKSKIEQDLCNIAVEIQSLCKELARLEQENKELKSGVYATKEIKQLREQFKLLHNAEIPCISAWIMEKIKIWEAEHMEKYHDGKDKCDKDGMFTYLLTPTSISMCIEVKCNAKNCRNKKDIFSIWD